MSRETTHIALPSPGIGTQRSVTLHRYGTRDATPKAYLQASIHADEIPAMMALHHLLQKLEAADQKGEITGEIIVVPYANPIGLSQRVNGQHLGRYELNGGGNFNRNWPNFFDSVVELVDGALGSDPEANVALVRKAMQDTLGDSPPTKELAALRMALAREAARADIVLDVHCDNDSLVHLFVVPENWPQGQDLSAALNSPVAIVAEPSGGDPFDEVWSTLWPRLAERFPEHPIPAACFSATVELRGAGDVSDELGARDGASLFRFLQGRGLIAGTPEPQPEPSTQVSTWNAVDIVTAPAAGILAYKANLGDWVKAGDVVAELIDPAAEDPLKARQAITCRGDGLLFTRRYDKYVAPGMTVAKIAGDEPLAHRTGYLMMD